MTPYLNQKTLYPALIKTAPDPQLGLVVVIPAYDEPHLEASLQALAQCRPPTSTVEVIVVINHAEQESPEVKLRNRQTYERAKAWVEEMDREWIQFHLLFCPDLPDKHAGVGLARKIGMDEACRRLEAVDNPGGLILGFDADSRCDADYLQQVEAYFLRHSQTKAASIYFEHPLSGDDFSEANYVAITLYELHLRYFINAQAWAGLPYAYQTIGSSMVVRCRSYQKQGGMNRRKAGEDFYFLHKFTLLDHFGQINSTRVIPSPRPSHRVPFGTGRAVGQLLSNDLQYATYAPASFVMLRQLVRQVNQLYHTGYKLQLAGPLAEFLANMQLVERLSEMRQHTASHSAFSKRFFRWFDAFMLMKFVHFIRDYHTPNVPLRYAVNWLTEVSGYSTGKQSSERDLLLLWRSIDRGELD